jgi:hypothetical protein
VPDIESDVKNFNFPKRQGIEDLGCQSIASQLLQDERLRYVVRLG